MNILLLNLTRLGDLLQCQAAVSDLNALGHRVGLVCLSNFSSAAKLMDGLAHVAPLPGAALLAALARDQESSGPPLRNDKQLPGWPDALAALSEFRDRLCQHFRVDTVCNLTPTPSARLLASFLAQDSPCSGFAVDEHGFGVNGNSWASFLQGASAQRGVSPFNVVDIFRMVVRPQENIPLAPGRNDLRSVEHDPTDTARILAREAPQGVHGYAALQLGASESKRRWPVSAFAALGDRLWNDARLCPVLLGSKDEQELAVRYAAKTNAPFITLCGRTNLIELGATLSQCRLLATNDTGTMHLAAGLGIPVFAFFLATAQPFDTGPYQVGSLCFEPDVECHPCSFGHACANDRVCREAVTPEIAGDIIMNVLSHPGRVNSLTVFPTKGSRVWLSETDEAGFMSLRSLSGHEHDARTLWFAVQRHYMRLFLNRAPGIIFTPDTRHISTPMPEAEKKALENSLKTAEVLLNLLLQQGKALCMHPAPLLRQRFFSTWDKVHENLAHGTGTAALAMLFAEATQAKGEDMTTILGAIEDFSALLRSMRQSLDPPTPQ